MTDAIRPNGASLQTIDTGSAYGRKHNRFDPFLTEVGPPHTRSVWPYASPGAPITTGVSCSSDALPAKVLVQCRIIGSM